MNYQRLNNYRPYPPSTNQPKTNGYGQPTAQSSPNSSMGSPYNARPPYPMGSPNLPQQRQFTPQTMASRDSLNDRTMIAQKIKDDCYSKFIKDNGQNVREITYLTHLVIQEYSQFSSSPPPNNLPPNQMGSVKERILVICTKFSGRVLLQKGKFNDQKGVYQIGRTWDLDELRAISRAGMDGFILSLNKDYFWRSNEGSERINRFTRHLTKTYGSFTGKYPLLNGFSLQEYELPEMPVKKSFSNTNASQEILNPQPDAQLLKSKSIKRKNLPNPILPVEPQMRKTSQSSFTFTPNPVPAPPVNTTNPSTPSKPNDLYKDMDFTSNGKLPMKPMKVLDRSPNMSQISQSTFDDISSKDAFESSTPPPVTPTSHPYRQTEEINDSQSFIFDEPAPVPQPPQPNQTRKVSDRLEENAALSRHLEKRLSKPNSDFGIEEASDSDEDKKTINESIDEVSELSNVQVKKSPTRQRINFDAIDSSIAEIEDFMDSQLNFDKGDEDNEVIVIESEESDRSFSMTESEITSENTEINETEDLNIQKNEVEKDAEIEELLEEIQWGVFDSSDELVKKMNNELNKIKYNNVKELINLDFSGNSMKNDLTTSLGEVENLNHIFKRMEIDLKNLTGEINSIENNSQGLQVKSINKKSLFNDLKSILDKISLNANDLSLIENFKEFENINKVEILEVQVAKLFNALETIDNDGLNRLNEMNSLKQFRLNYQQVSNKFIKHFMSFIKQQFSSIIHKLSDSDRINSKTIINELNKLIVYSSFTYFIKEISGNDFNELKFFVNDVLSEFMEKFLQRRIKNIKYTTPTISNVNTEGLKKSRTLRLRKDKLIGKLGFDDSRERSEKSEKLESTDDSKLTFVTSNTIEDIKVIIELVSETKELSVILTNFLGDFFHYDSGDFHDYLNNKPIEKRFLNEETNHYSNEIISNLNTVFGNYINLFIKKIVPVEYNIPLILDYLEKLTTLNNQEFFVMNFLKKLMEKFKNLWSKFIKNLIDAINKSVIHGKSGILPSIKNINQLFHLLESVLDKNHLENESVNSLLNKSYKDIIDSCINLFTRDDPLLKNNEFDEKERNYRNISILQNIFSISEQLSIYNNPRTSRFKSQIEVVFRQVQEVYFGRLLSQNLGKLVDMISTYETLSETVRAKKYSKKVIRTSLSNYSVKDLNPRVVQIRKKLEKHFLSGSSMFERDLLDRLWYDMEKQFVKIFSDLDKILDTHHDIDYHVSKQEIHSIFRSAT